MWANINILPIIPPFVSLNMMNSYEIFIIIWESYIFKRLSIFSKLFYEFSGPQIFLLLTFNFNTRIENFLTWLFSWIWYLKICIYQTLRIIRRYFNCRGYWRRHNVVMMKVILVVITWTNLIWKSFIERIRLLALTLDLKTWFAILIILYLKWIVGMHLLFVQVFGGRSSMFGWGTSWFNYNFRFFFLLINI